MSSKKKKWTWMCSFFRLGLDDGKRGRKVKYSDSNYRRGHMRGNELLQRQIGLVMGIPNVIPNADDSRRWLFIDANYLCHRAFHSTGDLSHEGVKTGVLYGFFRDVLKFIDLHQTQSLAFCFDLGVSLRAQVYPAYKYKRWNQKRTKQERRARRELNRQITKLRIEVLPELGYRNVFAAEGYEADDIIASLCKRTLKGNDRATIISADQDLYQLLSKRVDIWRPTKETFLTKASFVEQYGILPKRWPEVKAIAGCASDEIKGVEGIGEKRAIQYVQGKLSSQYKLLVTTHQRTWESNLHLVKLPFMGTPTFKFRADEPSRKKWKQVLRRLGISSLERTIP